MAKAIDSTTTPKIEWETLTEAALAAADEAARERDHSKRDALQQQALRLWNAARVARRPHRDEVVR
jgi:hypothetical protein